jgi:hypothetical protein
MEAVDPPATRKARNMKQLKLVGLALVAMLSLSSLIAAASQAAATLPSTLPNATFAEPIVSDNSSGKTTFGGGLLELESPSSFGDQEGFASKLGLFSVVFTEVKSVNLGVKCTGLNTTTEGEVEIFGTYHIRDYKTSTGTLKIATIFLLSPVHFSCASTLVVVAGCVAGATTPENTLTKTVTVALNKVGSNNEIITVLNEENTATELCQLLAKEGSSATKLSLEAQKSELTCFTQSSSEVSILLMPL